ncbi:hypothetical protein J2Z62_000724 [Mycoplasmoides fastidiosum]|uniref:Uncharacterized protein n=1 Tax=Mycoplasmoides fastidiosum TaxID=92758 RepID=A0ABU0M004_9BACT|nr:hypothetical protein [Mycoplasmoides fastidiosum]MDQ0514286.1 hypothetical protein [Mycoplasmoides fastidiosum]UUD38107.1 hypothetical protein NPA10_01845 [Mycoplasmoides fastidiosum]
MKPKFWVKPKTAFWCGSLVTAVSTSLVLAACSSTTAPYTRNEFLTKNNVSATDIRLDAFRHDYTLQATAKTELSNSLAAPLIEYEYSGKTELNGQGEVQNNNYTRYRIRLSLAKAVYVTQKDNPAVPLVFDNDNVTENLEVDDPLFTGVKVLRSNDNRSVNSDAFNAALKKATKVQFTLKDNIYWANAQGEKTKYQLVPEDFFVKYARTALQDQDYRHAQGGSVAADQFAVAKTYHNKLKADNRFSVQSNYSNEYLIKLFDIDSEKLRHENTFITPVNVGGVEQKAITFDGVSGATQPDFVNFFAKALFNANYFTPAPSQFIAENMAKNPKDVTGLAAQVGYYWYGADFKDMLYVGPYYVTRSDTQFESYEMNPQFYDQTWVKAADSVRRVVVQNDTTDPLVFRQSEFEEYRQGNVARINFANLDDQQRATVLTSKTNEFNLNYEKVPDYNSTGRGLLAWKPIVYSDPANPLTTTTPYAFNDAFSLLMYGVNKKDLEAGKQDVNYYWTGDGYIFRSLLSQAFNYYAFNNTINTDTSFWGSVARPDGLIEGSDQATSPKKRLSQFENQYSFFFYGGANNQTRFERTLKQDQERFVNSQQNREAGIQAANFDLLKAEMQRLLNKFYGAGGLGESLKNDPENKQVKLIFYDRFQNTPAVRRAATESALTALKALDPEQKRIDVSQEAATSVNEPIVRLGKAPYSYSGWHYDVDSYAGFLQFFLYANRDYSLFTALFSFDPADDTSTTPKTNQAQSASQANVVRFKNFPEFSKFAKAFKESKTVFPDIDSSNSSQLYQKLKKANNKDWSNVYEVMRPEGNTEYNTVLALSKFGLEYGRTLTNEQSATLNQEITSLMGFSLNSAAGYQLSDKPLPLLINRHYDVPVSVESGSLSKLFVRVRN